MITEFKEWARVQARSPEEKATPHTTVLPSTEPRFQPFNYTQIVRDGFEKNELVYTCIQRIHAAFVEAPLKTFDKEDVVIPNSPLEMLFEKPNRFQSYVEFLELSFIYFILSGNLFWEKVRNDAGKLVELWPLRPDLIEIVPDTANFISGYFYNIGGERFPIAVDDMFHMKWGGAIDQTFGVSPLKSTFRQIDTDNEATDTTKVVFQNAAFPTVIIKPQEEIDAAKAKRLTSRFLNRFGGNKRGKPMFAQQGMDIETLKINLNALLFPDLRDITETRILMALGVPPIIAGTKVGLTSATYSNAGEFRQFFFDQTINPLYRRFEAKIAIDLMPEFATDSKQRAKFDTLMSSFLREAQFKTQDQANKLVIGGWVKINEGRRMIHHPADPKQDGYLRPSSTVFIPADGSAPKPSMPVAPPIRGPRNGQANGSPRRPAPSGASPKADDRFALLNMAMDRVGAAQEFAESFRSVGMIILDSQKQQILTEMNRQMKSLGKTEMEDFIFGMSSTWPIEARAQIEGVMGTVIDEAADLTFRSMGLTTSPILMGDRDAFVQARALEFANQVSATSVSQIRSRLSEGFASGLSELEIRNLLTSQMEDWSASRLDMIVRTETVRASNAGALFGYQKAGVQEYEWVTADVPCVWCEPLDGTIITMGESFFQFGDVYQPEGASRPLVMTYSDVFYPPLHGHCNCTILAVPGSIR